MSTTEADHAASDPAGSGPAAPEAARPRHEAAADGVRKGPGAPHVEILSAREVPWAGPGR